MSKKRKPVIQHAATIAERDGGWQCRYCGIQLIPPGTDIQDTRYYTMLQPPPAKVVKINSGYADFQVDHIVAKSRGGTNQLDNLALACCWCNQRKGNKSEAEYLAWLAVQS